MPRPRDTPTISVRVLFFGAARDAVGHEEIDFELNSPGNATSAREQLLSAYPALQRFGNSLLFAVNQEYAQPDRQIQDSDELAVFPPVSGGSESATEAQRRGDQQPKDNDAWRADVSSASFSASDFFELTTDPIDLGAVARRVVLP